MTGIHLTRLRVSNGSDHSEIDFARGVNLITGASDTGKSYIFSALRYVLGRSQEPKEIIESNGYKDIFLELVSNKTNATYTLYRSVGSSDVHVFKGALTAFTSSNSKKFITQGSISDNHISTFLLSLVGISNKRLLKSGKKGTTQNLSVKNILGLTFVAETEIMKETSPFYFSNQYSDRILEQSLLSFILTGHDYSDVVEKEDKSIRETRINGKIEFINYQVGQFGSYKSNLVEQTNPLISSSQKEIFEQLDSELQQNVKDAKLYAEQKEVLIKELSKANADLRQVQEVTNRFKILELQYISDIERLDFIVEAKLLSDQLGNTICPICSSSLDENHLKHITENEEFVGSAMAELEKSRSKLLDLRSAIKDQRSEEAVLSNQTSRLNGQLKDIEDEIQSNFSTKIKTLKSSLRDYVEIENVSNEIRFIDKQVKSLVNEKGRLENLLQIKEASENVSIINTAVLNTLASHIEQRLVKWNFESFVSVAFDASYDTFDIVISGKTRRSFGKGKRAIAYTACLVGLLDYCHAESSDFTNLLVLDSPLTTFEEKKHASDADSLEAELISSFFLDIVDIPEDVQIIIFDNKSPNEDTLTKLEGRLAIQTFTGDPLSGRRGFFVS